MRAIIHQRYGRPANVLELRELDEPDVPADGVLVRVGASSVNPVDWYGVTGRPMLMRLMGSGLRAPKEPHVGSDFAGTVEQVGKDVTGFAAGDEVFGVATGALGELAVARKLARKPPNISVAEAACVSVAGLTALQGLRDKAAVEPGRRVLINGASGGVGTFAVQIAKSLGADHVIDYTREDFTRRETRYDVVFDIAGSRRWAEVKRVLEPDGVLVIVGAAKGGRILGPVRRIARLKLASLPSRQKAIFFITQITSDDLEALAELLETGVLKPVIDRTYALADVTGAFDYLGEGHARGKIVVTI